MSLKFWAKRSLFCVEFEGWKGDGGGKGGYYMDDTTCRLATGHAAVIHSGLSYPFFVDFSSTSIERISIKETTLQLQIFR